MLRRKRLTVLILSIVFILFFQSAVSVKAESNFSLILLSHYQTELKVGDSFYLVAITSTGKKASFSSSDSKIVSVNTYGKVSAKKTGTATIYAKIQNAEASCKVTVQKTIITINSASASIENGSTLKLSASSSTSSPLKWKSSKPSIASVSEAGVVTSKKPGEAIITVSADGSSAECIITVKKPQISLNRTNVRMYRKDTVQLSAAVSSGLTPIWKSNRTSVATVDQNGKITAVKNGIAIITATVDGVSKSCEVVVQQPEVILSESELTLKIGGSFSLKAQVSSGNAPEWYSSNTSVAVVSDKGVITAKQKGKAYIYAKEDGIKSRCTITVTE